MTHVKTYNKSPRRINHKATKSKTNTGTTALERSVEHTTGGFKALSQLANFTLGPETNLTVVPPLGKHQYPLSFSSVANHTVLLILHKYAILKGSLRAL